MTNIYILNIEGLPPKYYTSRQAMIIDSNEVLPSQSKLDKHDWSQPLQWGSDCRIEKVTAINVAEAKAANWVDELPPDIGAEHFEED
jgi:hypothetical protein